MFSAIQKSFTKTIPAKKLKDLAILEVDSKGEFVQQIKNTKLVLKSDGADYSKYELSKAVSSDISSLQSRKRLRFLESLLRFGDSTLENSYTKNDILKVNSEVFEGKRKFANFIKDLGYLYDTKSKAYMPDMKIYSYLDYV